MAKGGLGVFRRTKRRKVRSADEGSDEDYTVNEEGEFDDSEDEYCSSLNDDTSEESLGGLEEKEEDDEGEDEDEDEDEDVEVKRKKAKKVSRPREQKDFAGRRKTGTSEESLGGLEEEEEDDEDEDEEVEGKRKKAKKVSRPRVRKDFAGKRKTRVLKQRKNHRLSYKEEDDNFDDDDDDDFEVTLDDIDMEDEEETPVLKKCRNMRRPSLPGKRVTRGCGIQSNRNPSFEKKTIKKKPRSLRVRRKTKYDEDEGTTDINPVGEKKKKVTGRRSRRRRLSVVSDSDFVSSGSSDLEYTISEEEREQIKEANELCRGLTNWRSSTSSRKIERPRQLPERKRLRKKNKEKVINLEVEVAKQVCGICLSEEGKRTIRGTLNCCSHYFCFACIMEWSKVESRCPICKQRFRTISKPSRSNAGFDLRAAVIQVPERDQVYQPSEEELRGYLDPYENVICTECQQGGDDALMLLCDLCDSPAHTYCVGLGREVPEGNWYCDSCRPAALSSSNPPDLNRTPDLRANNNSVGSSPTTNLRETFDLNEMYVPDTPLTEETGQCPSPRQFFGDMQAPSPALGSGAVTVSDRRRIQRQIHQLLNGRMRQQPGRIFGTEDAISGNSLFGSQVGRNRELAPQYAVTPMRTFQNILSHDRLPDNHVQSPLHRDIFSAHSNRLGGPINQNQASISANSSVPGIFQSDFRGVNEIARSSLGHQQLHPCSSSRSHIGFDASMSPRSFREATIPSRPVPAFQDPYTHHFS